MTLPTVSIVIPSYKAAHFESCLRSAVGQTYPHIEIMVSDNCPTEDIRTICSRYPGVIYQRNSVTGTGNVLASMYSGKGHLIKPLFDDDILHPFCVERMVAVMQAEPAVELVFSASQVIDIDNQRTETRRPYTASGRMTGAAMQQSMALGMRNFVGEFSSVMFRRETLWSIGWQDLFRLPGHDYTLGLADVAAYCNLARQGQVFYIDEELSYFRYDQRLQSNSNPYANPHFGNCFSDYVDLLVSSHMAGVINDEELWAQDYQVAALSVRLGNVFPQTQEARQRYLDYRATRPVPASVLAAAAPAPGAQDE
jgi:glycosyltransferase involved in cell wall biosynthesis